MNLKTLRPYLLAEDIKAQKKNREFHLQGMYIYEAFATALSNAFKKKGSAPIKYREEPYEMKTMDEREQERRQLEKEERMKAQFAAFAEGIKRKLENSQGKGDKDWQTS